MTSLFDPITLRGLTLKNRIWLSPMCQHSVELRDGVPTDWHFVHLGARAVGGFGLILTESTAVAPDGRISPEDTGMWDAAQVAGWRRIVDFVHDRRRSASSSVMPGGRLPPTRRGTDTAPCP